MALPTRRDGETDDGWMDRCMADPAMIAEFPDPDQRAAVCARRGGLAEQRPRRLGQGAAGGGADEGPVGGETGDGDAARRQLAGAAVLKVGGTPVREFRLFRWGRNEAERAVRGGSFEFTQEMADEVLSWFRRLGRPLAIDFEHQMIGELNTRVDRIAPAAGWISGLETRADGLWATNVEWTAEAAELLAKGAYRFYSPVVFWTDASQTRIRELGPVALTNDPALRGVVSLAAKRSDEYRVSSSESDDQRSHDGYQGVLCVLAGQPFQTPAVVLAQGGNGMDEIAQALGLPAGASVAEILDAIARLKGGGGGKIGNGGDGSGSGIGGGAQQGTSSREQEGATVLKIAAALALGPEIKDVDALVAAVRKRPAEGSEVVTALRRRIDEQAQAIAELTTANQLAAFRAELHSPEHEGKVPPADEEQYFALFRENRKLFDTVLRNTPRKVHGHSLFTGQRPTTARGPDTPEGWKTEYDQSPELQAEFGSAAAYMAFRQADAAGLVHILKR